MHSRILILIIAIAVTAPESSVAQETSTDRFKPMAKGKMFVHWGYNRSAYSNSDISFKGPGYDFELQDVVAKDRQSPFSYKTYLGLTSFTIPQYNFVVGFFLKDNLSISFNADHMKYVVVYDQESRITGDIDKGDSKYNGSYEDDLIILSTDFLYFEHTDGLNYENVEVTRYFNFWMSKNENLAISGNMGVAVGALVPRSNVRFLGEGTDEFHLAGFGTSASGGVTITLFKHGVFQYKVKGGYISMPDIVINGKNREDRAKQNFWFMERLFTLGANIPIKNR